MERTIDFLKYKTWVFIGSWIFIITLVAITMFRGGFNWGIDFVGGHKIIASFQDKSVNEGVIRNVLRDFNPTVQQVGDDSKNEYIITTKLVKGDKNAPASAQNSCLAKNDLLKKTLFDKYPQLAFVNVESAGAPDSFKLTVRFNDPQVNEAAVKDVLRDYNAAVQKSGNSQANEFIITADFAQKNQSAGQQAGCGVELLKLTLASKYSAVKIESEETVGPAIGEYLRKSAWKLTLMAVLLMSVYLAFRFEIK